MEIKRIILFIIFLSAFVIAKSQAHLNENYYKNLEKLLNESERFSKVKFVQTKYSNGQIKSQRMFVKLKNKPGWKYLMIGKEFVYFKNGILAYSSYTDTASLMLSDTIFKYDIDGKIMQKIILDKSEGYDDSYIFQKMRIFKYSERWPSSYISVVYQSCDGYDYFVCPVKYFENKVTFLVDGYVLYFDKTNSIVKKEKYIMGKKVE
jgi:hypothetical protein